MEIIKPYSDDYMTWDADKERYLLTERAITAECGVDLRGRLARGNATNAGDIINAICNRCSEMVYNYIHQFNRNTEMQDTILASFKSTRKILHEAMCDQMLYLLMRGDLSFSTKPEERKMAMSDEATGILNRIIPEMGFPITYGGDLYGYARYFARQI